MVTNLWFWCFLDSSVWASQNPFLSDIFTELAGCNIAFAAQNLIAIQDQGA